jgi:glutamate-1-semialdehyde aminotransferase
MLDRGVALAPGAYEIMFLSLAHDDGDLVASIDAAREAAAVAAAQ